MFGWLAHDAHVRITGSYYARLRGAFVTGSRSHSGMVRDDPSGSIRSSLQAHIDVARGLREDAELVDDYEGFIEWRDLLAHWRSSCGALLLRDFEREAVLEFFRGVRIRDTHEDRWRRGIHAGMRELMNMIELLCALQSTLMARGA
jgi:hypothetical protein